LISLLKRASLESLEIECQCSLERGQRALSCAGEERAQGRSRAPAM